MLCGHEGPSLPIIFKYGKLVMLKIQYKTTDWGFSELQIELTLNFKCN